jgi:uncharacterized membrane protein YdbT with pleckstrin-like domain
MEQDNTRQIMKNVPGEETFFEIRPSYFILVMGVMPILIALIALGLLFFLIGTTNILIFLILFIVGIFVSIVVFLNWYYTIYRFTNKRVENRIGILGSREEEVSLDDIQAVDFDQTFWGSVFNYGNVVIKASGSNREVDFLNITDPKKIAARISDMAIPPSDKAKNSLDPSSI